MNKKILLTIFTCILTFSMVSALDNLGTFDRGECVRVTQTCNNADWINISSISYPNSSVAVSNIEMTSAGSGEFYYDFCLTSVESGRYDVRGISNGCEKDFATYFLIGSNLFVLLIILYVFAFVFLILSVFVNEELFVYISGICFLLTGILIMIYGIGTLNDENSRYLSFISLGLGLLFSIGAYIYNGYNHSDYEEEYD